jgi:hypothetical protein
MELAVWEVVGMNRGDGLQSDRLMHMPADVSVGSSIKNREERRMSSTSQRGRWRSRRIREGVVFEEFPQLLPSRLDGIKVIRS